jgi:hypothetical protein
LIEIGRYREALAALQQGEIISRELLGADRKNIRAVQDLQAGLSREAECYQDRAAGIFPEEGADRIADAENALKVLSEQRSLLEEILRIEPLPPETSVTVMSRVRKLLHKQINK